MSMWTPNTGLSQLETMVLAYRLRKPHQHCLTSQLRRRMAMCKLDSMELADLLVPASAHA